MEKCDDPMGWDGFLTLCLYELQECQDDPNIDLKYAEFSVKYCNKVIAEDLYFSA